LQAPKASKFIAKKNGQFESGKSRKSGKKMSPVRNTQELSVQNQTATTYNLKASPQNKAGNATSKYLSRPKSTQNST